jgi:NAD(P)-dependent dehydrogenase (short-subunit alcohol dehydrogenase family)
MRLRDKICLVTGAASGIGRATARHFAAEGASVVLADARRAAADAAAALRASGLAAEDATVDVADEASVAALFAGVLQSHGRLDVLVNCAGIELTRTATETSLAEWRRVIDVNLTGTFLCCREALRRLGPLGGCTIVNVASELALVGASEMAAYCASKGGVLQLTRALAVDHTRDGFRINCVCPGPVDTPLLESSIAASKDPRRERREIVADTLVGRVGRPDEIAAAILFLSCDESSYVVGGSLVVDGGTTT